VLAEAWRALDQLDSPLGAYARSCKGSGVPPSETAQPPRGDELLPLSPEVMSRFTALEPDKRDSMKLILAVLSLLAMGGRYDPKRSLPPPPSLSKGQEIMLDHLMERLDDLSQVGTLCPPVEEATKTLGSARFDYCGEPVMVMEELVAEKVIPVWPKIGEAAVQPVMSYLPSGMAEMLEDPRNCLRPEWEWPETPHRSRVMASQDEWDKIVEAGFARGLMKPLEEDEVFRDRKGQKVLNGAGGVRKLKKIGGEERQMQRFISNLIPANEYHTLLSGGDRYLPYLGQLTLLEQTEEETYLVDSEDFCSCFNLFTLPDSWLWSRWGG